MKKLFLIAMIIILMPVVLTAKTEDSYTRGNFWVDLQFQSKFHESGIGITARFNTRYNFNYIWERNGVEQSTATDEAYLQDLYFGLMWSKVFFKKLTFVVSPQYRLEAWYADNAKPVKDYIRHSIYWPFLFKYDFGKVILKYQLCFWNPFRVKSVNQEDEFYIRNLIGVIIPLSKLIDVFIEDEIYVLTTADDNQGQDAFYRNAVWAGVTIKPLEFLSVKIAYVNYYTLQKNSSIEKNEMFDHFIYVGAMFYVDTTKNSKVEGEKKVESKNEK